MNWQKNLEQIAEINDIYCEITAKLESDDINQIFERNDKYTKNPNINPKTGIQENQLNVLTYQMIMLYKVIEILKTKPLSNIYSKIPTDFEEATNYISSLKKEGELLLNVINMVIDIEKLAQIEYSAPNYFQDTEYAKKVYFENSLFLNYYLKAPLEQSEICSRIIKIKLDEYLEKLTLDQKQTLIVETLALSYDRNAFKNLNSYRLFRSINLSPTVENPTYIKYLLFKECLINNELKSLDNKELSEIYDEFKGIYETKFLKEKVLKK